MNARLQLDGREVRVDLARPLDLSVELDFQGPQVRHFGAPRASSQPYSVADFPGSVAGGASCNCESITLIPHCNGTHTECVGHITNERIHIIDCLKDTFIPAMLVSVEPESARDVKETYSVNFGDSDPLITRNVLEDRLSDLALNSAVIIRTLPNDDSKLTREYTDKIPPYFSTEAIDYILSSGVKHLLVDTPSIDRLYDEGKLSNHRTFWGIEPGSFEINPATRMNDTITELIYVPNEVEDGRYLLNLQIAPFATDAAPSRPVLFRTLKTS